MFWPLWLPLVLVLPGIKAVALTGTTQVKQIVEKKADLSYFLALCLRSTDEM
jgi:hypothetical protein